MRKLLVFLLCTVSLAHAAPTPQELEATLAKVMSVAKNPKSDGRELIELVRKGSFRDFTTKLVCPGAVDSYIELQGTKWNGDQAKIHYGWLCQLSNLPTERAHFTQELSRLFPGLQPEHEEVDAADLTIWNVQPDVYVVLVEDHKGLLLRVGVQRTLTSNRQKTLENILARHRNAIASASSSEQLASLFNTAVCLLFNEGLSRDEALKSSQPLMQQIAQKDFGAVYQIMSGLALSEKPPMLAILTADQRQKIQARESEEAARLQAKLNYPGLFAVYNAFYVHKDGSYVYVCSYDRAAELYTVANAWLEPKQPGTSRRLNRAGPTFTVPESWFHQKGRAEDVWYRIEVKPCANCFGSGSITTERPVDYHYSEKGIYNKYEYSGTRIERTTTTCGACSGQGSTEYRYK